MTEPPQPDRPDDIHVRPFLSRAGRFVVVLVGLSGDALLVDAAYETWRALSPERHVVAAAVGLFVALTLWVLKQGGRIGGRGWLTDPGAPYIVLLGLFTFATGTPGEMARGLVVLGQPAETALVAALLALVVLATLRFAGPWGVRAWWLRLAGLALGGYAAWSLALALRAHVTFTAVMGGDSAWRGFPAWARGGHVGAFAVLPLAFAREFGVAMTKLTLSGVMRWMLIFGLGIWIASRAAGA